MARHILLILILFFSSLTSCALFPGFISRWISDKNSGSSMPVIIGGYTKNGVNVSNAAVWTENSTYTDNNNSVVNGVALVYGRFAACGTYFENGRPFAYIKYQNDDEKSIFIDPSDVVLESEAMGIYSDGINYYVTGWVQTNGVSNYYYTVGTNPTVPMNNLTVGTCISVMDNSIVVGGNSGSNMNQTSAVFWISNNQFFLNNPASINALTVNNGIVYTAGVTYGSTNYASVWSNTSGYIFINNQESYAAGITVDNGIIYTAGTIRTNQPGETAQYLAACYWRNQELVIVDWSSSRVRGIYVDGGDVYLAGAHYEPAPGPGWVACYWKNGGRIYLTNVESEATSICGSY